MTTTLICIAILVLLVLSTAVIRQGYVGVVTRFGRYDRTMQPGLNFKLPFV